MVGFKFLGDQLLEAPYLKLIGHTSSSSNRLYNLNGGLNGAHFCTYGRDPLDKERQVIFHKMGIALVLYILLL